MPRKKIKKTVHNGKRKTRENSFNLIRKQFSISKWTESYSSFLLGIVVVIVAVLFGVTLIRQQTHVQQTSSLSTGPTPTVAPSPTPGVTYTENGNTYYIVKPNDSLWSIAASVYNNGYKWSEIAKANNLTNPGTIFTGNKLLLPNPPTSSELGKMMQNNNAQSNDITANTYTIQKGDTLWDIAVRAYSNGYKWTEIAKTNSLANPDLIFSGNMLTIPRDEK